jgi:uncharacterized membrane protein YhaH (DUF805 family)
MATTASSEPRCATRLDLLAFLPGIIELLIWTAAGLTVLWQLKRRAAGTDERKLAEAEAWNPAAVTRNLVAAGRGRLEEHRAERREAERAQANTSAPVQSPFHGDDGLTRTTATDHLTGGKLCGRPSARRVSIRERLTESPSPEACQGSLRRTISRSQHTETFGGTMSYPQYPQSPSQQQQNFQGGEPPLWAPYYGASLPVAVKRFFKKYATFSGRASRSEYWWWVLVSGVVGIILNIIIGAGTTVSASAAAAPSYGPVAIFGIILGLIWGLATIVPSLAVSARRLHDGNFSGWLLLLHLIPFLGSLAILVMMILPSNPAGQRFDQPTGP